MISFIIAGTKKKSASSATKIALAVSTPKLKILLIVAVVNTKNPNDDTIALPVSSNVNLTALSTSLYSHLITPKIVHKMHRIIHRQP